MKRFLLSGITLSLVAALVLPVHAQSIVKEKMQPSILNYMVTAAPEYSIMIRAINAARMEETFSTTGPITVFAPVNKAFDVLPAGTVDNLLKPALLDSLQKMLTCHVISGSWTASELERKIREAGGEFSIPTIGDRCRLSFMLEDNKVVVKDGKGFKTALGIPNKESNGLIYQMDKLLLP